MGSNEYRRVKSRSYTRACPTGKRRYPTRDGAYHEFVRLETKLANQGLPPPINIYRCHNCFGWHVTTKGLTEGGASHNGEGKEKGR